MRISIRTRVIFGFSVILFLIVVMGGFWFYSTQFIKQDYERITDKNLPIELGIEELRSVSMEQVAAVRAYIIYKDEKYPVIFNELNNTVIELIKSIDEKIYIEEYEDYCTKFTAQHDEYIKVANKVFELVKSGDAESAIKAAQDGRDNVEAIKQITKDWEILVENENILIKKAIDKNLQETIIEMIIIFAVSALVVLLIVFMINKSVVLPIRKLNEVTMNLAGGDLTKIIPNFKGRDEIQELRTSFVKMIDNMRNMIKNMSNASKELSQASSCLSSSSGEVNNLTNQVFVTVSELAKGATEQAASTEQGNTSLKEIIQGLETIVDDMASSRELSEKAMEVVAKGEKSVRYQEEKVNENTEMSTSIAEAITDLSNRSSEIGRILEVIKGIADQTHLLAINAAIEAARAGEQGRGFAVVSDEIKKLAEQSATSVKQIGTIISEVQISVERSVQQIEMAGVVAGQQAEALNDTVKAFNDISYAVKSITGNIISVSEASKTLSNNATLTGEVINDIASITQQSAASTQEVVALTEHQTSAINGMTDSLSEMTKLAAKLKEEVNVFKV